MEVALLTLDQPIEYKDFPASGQEHAHKINALESGKVGRSRARLES